jgi:hypothetical protein
MNKNFQLEVDTTLLFQIIFHMATSLVLAAFLMKGVYDYTTSLTADAHDYTLSISLTGLLFIALYFATMSTYSETKNKTIKKTFDQITNTQTQSLRMKIDTYASVLEITQKPEPQIITIHSRKTTYKNSNQKLSKKSSNTIKQFVYEELAPFYTQTDSVFS